MNESADPLPTDIAALHAMVAAAHAERDAAVAQRDAAFAQRDEALSQNDRLRHLLRQLQRAQFGQRSEKLDPEQFALALEDIEQAIAGSEAEDDKKDEAGARARAEKRRSIAGATAHLPRVHVTIAPEDTSCLCCRGLMHVIGEESSERLDVIPAQFRVLVTHRSKYACRACEEKIVQAPAPERLIKGGLPTEAMVAHVLTAKYAWHLPLYRQAQMLAAQGLDIKRYVLRLPGWAMRQPSSSRFTFGCASSSWPPARSQLMRRWRRCSTPAAAAPRRGTSGPSLGTIDLGAAPTRRPSPTATLQVAGQCMR